MGLRNLIERALNRLWYENSWQSMLLMPLSLVFEMLVALRRRSFSKAEQRFGFRQQAVSLDSESKTYQAPVPVIVVGNLSVGGSGKTPLVIAMIEYLQLQGYSPGIVSRGYGGKPPSEAYVVSDSSPVEASGDEPLLIKQRTGVPVVVGRNRPYAVEKLLQTYPDIDVIITDDGLQHYALGRDIEIVVVDGQRGFGNGRLLPAGPLREPISRLRSAPLAGRSGQQQSILVVNGSNTDKLPGYSMQLLPSALQPVRDTASRAAPDHCRVHAVAAIGNPQRFFTTLRNMGLDATTHSFPDHHHYSVKDFRFVEPLPIVMTEKDAVKCRGLGLSDAWYLPVHAELPAEFWQTVSALLDPLREKLQQVDHNNRIEQV